MPEVIWPSLALLAGTGHKQSRKYVISYGQQLESSTFPHSNHVTSSKRVDTLICHTKMRRNSINFLYNPGQVIIWCLEIVPEVSARVLLFIITIVFIHGICTSNSGTTISSLSICQKCQWWGVGPLWLLPVWLNLTKSFYWLWTLPTDSDKLLISVT